MGRKILAWTIAFLVLAVTVSAEPGGGPKPTSHGSPGPKTTVSNGNSAPKPATAGPKTTTKVTKTTAPVKSTKPVSAKTTASMKPAKTTTSMKPAKTTTSMKPAKTTTSMKPAKTTATMKPAKTTTTASPGKSGKTTTSAASAPATTLPPPPPTTTTTPPLSPAQQKLLRNTNLASKLQSRLPPGTDLQAAAAGFRNLGQFVAAVNVSNNLGLSFTELKTRMVDQGMSLGRAIQDTRANTTDTTAVVARAERDADDMIRTSEAETTKTKTKPKKTGTGTK